MLTIAIIGRTNVGKSTLFNRILGEERAIVSELAHTTRDRTSGTTGWRGVEMRVVDTGGVEDIEGVKGVKGIQEMGGDNEEGKQTSIEFEIRSQAERAVTDADLLVLVTDARDGVLPGERTIANALRRLGKPIVLACNKAETKRLRDACLEFGALGLGDPLPVSARTGMGVGDLLDAIVARKRRTPDDGLQTTDRETQTPESDVSRLTSDVSVRIAIVGEPNVGKSSLLNAILGREEVIVHPEPFTTRDTHDVELEVEPPSSGAGVASESSRRNSGDGVASESSRRNGAQSPSGADVRPLPHMQRVILVDTAGIRRAATRSARVVRNRLEQIERIAVGKSRHAIERADVVVLVLDAMQPATRHTKQLARLIADSGRACVLVVNKVDLLDRDGRGSKRSPPSLRSGEGGRGGERWGENDDKDAEIDLDATVASIHELFRPLAYAPIVLTSAVTGAGVSDILPSALRAADNWKRRLDAPALAAVHAAVKRAVPAARTPQGRRMSHFIELTQTGTAPPSFLLRTRRRVRLPRAIPDIAERVLRAHAAFEGTPLRITVQSVKA